MHTQIRFLQRQAGIYTPSSEKIACSSNSPPLLASQEGLSGVGPRATIRSERPFPATKAKQGAAGGLSCPRPPQRPLQAWLPAGEARPTLGKLVSIQTRALQHPENLSNRTNQSSGEDCYRTKDSGQSGVPPQHRSWGSMLRPQGAARSMPPEPRVTSRHATYSPPASTMGPGQLTLQTRLPSSEQPGARPRTCLQRAASGP